MVTPPWKSRVHSNEWDEQALMPYRAFSELHRERDIAHPPPTSSRLLDLPPKIRNCIYRWNLILQKPVELAPRARNRPVKQKLLRSFEGRHHNEIMPRLSMLHTSKLVCKEGSSIFFGENAFRFSNLEGRYFHPAFFYTVGPRIRHWSNRSPSVRHG